MAFGVETWDSAGRKQVIIDGKPAKIISITTTNLGLTPPATSTPYSAVISAVGMQNTADYEAYVYDNSAGWVLFNAKGTNVITVYTPVAYAMRNVNITVIVIRL
jgi:hypothetical protein